MSAAEALGMLVFMTLLIWAPVFGIAYARRPFGGAARNYLAAYGGVCAATIAIFVVMALIENAS